MNRIEMQALTAPRAPSPSSLSTVADECEDTVSLPSTEGSNENTHASWSEPRTLVVTRADGQQSCDNGVGKKSHIRPREQQAALQDGDAPIEEPKIIWTKSRKRAFRHFLALHFVPVAITLTLFWLYLKGLQWSATDIQLKALLFGAKLHESLIFISLADILFHRIRYQLLTGRGISFGLLVSPFRVSSPFSLFQTPFLASARFTLKSGPELVTILLVALVSVLALLAAPSSGVLMLPRYDWWQIPGDEAIMINFTQLDLGAATYLGAPFENLFPSLIDGTFAPNLVIDDGLDTQTLSNRFEQLISGLDKVLVDGSLRANANITVVNGATVDAFGLAYQEERWDDCDLGSCQYFAKVHNTTVENLRANCTSSSGAETNPYCDCASVICQSVAVQATSPLALVTQKLFDRYRTWMPASSSLNMITAQALDEKEGHRTWRQPSVSIQCSTVPHDGPKELSFEHFGSSQPFSMSPDRQLLNAIKLMNDQGAPFATYIDISRLLPPLITVSTAMLIQGDRDAEMANKATYLCLVDARWIESEVWFTAPYATVMNSGVSVDSVRATFGSNTTSPAATGQVIKITNEYANSLDTLSISSSLINMPLSTDEISPFEFIHRYCRKRVVPGLQPKCSMLAHALYLTDSLRRIQSQFGYETGRSFPSSSLANKKWTKLDYRVYHQLHAYEFEGSIIKLSMSVLLVHMMLVYAHLLLLVLGDGWCSMAWSELGELMALAILTRPSPLLQNTGGGIKNWRTWRLRTFVREVTPEGRLELVLKETEGSPRVLVELEDGREGTLVEPEADRRYS